MAEVLTVRELGRRFKAKYPQYADLEDSDLGRRLKTKFSAYSDVVDLDPATGLPPDFTPAPAGQPPRPQVATGLPAQLAGAGGAAISAIEDFAVRKPGEALPSVPSRPVALPPTAETAEAISPGVETLKSIATASPAAFVSREPQLFPEVAGPPAPETGKAELPISAIGQPGLAVPPTEEGVMRMGTEMERAARSVVREVLGLINPVNAAVIAASGGAATVARQAANSAAVRALLGNVPGGLKFLDVVGEVAVPTAVAGIAGKQTKDQLDAAREAYEAGDATRGQEHVIGALTSALITAGGAGTAVSRGAGAIRTQPSGALPTTPRLRKQRAIEAREQATELRRGGREAAAEIASKQAQQIGTEEWAKVFGKGTPQLLDGKPVTAEFAGVSTKGRPVYHLRNQQGDVVYSGDATMLRTRLQAGQAPKGTRAAEKEVHEAVGRGARELRMERQAEAEVLKQRELTAATEAIAKQAPTRKPAIEPVEAPKGVVAPVARPKAEKPQEVPAEKTEPIVSAPAPEAKPESYRLKTNKVAPGDPQKPGSGTILEVSPEAQGRHKGQARVEVTEVDDDGQIWAEGIDEQGQRVKETGAYINLAGEKDIQGYRIAPKEAPQSTPEQVRVPQEPETEPVAEAQPAPQEVAPEEPVRPPKLEERPSYVPGVATPGTQNWRLPVSEIVVEPERFQFKSEARGPGGVTDKLADVKKWDSSAESTMLVWRDPADGKVRIVDGHHRLDLAKRLGVESIEPEFLSWDEAPTAKDARTVGVIRNLREGNVTSIDVARFMRDTGSTSEESLRELGIPTRSKAIREGQALANLDELIFQDIVMGRLREDYGIAIAEAGKQPHDQAQARKVIEAREDRTGRLVSADMASAIARRVAQADTRTEKQETLFGEIETQESLFEQEADLTSYIRRQLGREKRLFGTISQAGAPEQLQAKGNVLAREQNLQAAQELRQSQELFDRLADRAGPIDDVIKEGARRLAEGENAATVRRETYEKALAEVRATLPGRQAEVRQDRGQDRAPGRAAPEEAAQLGQSVLYAGVPAAKQVLAAAVRRSVKDLGILKEGAITAAEATKDWRKEWEKSPLGTMYYFIHMPSFIADTQPLFRPLFDRARDGYHERMERLAGWMETIDPFLRLKKAPRRALSEQLIEATLKKERDIPGTGLDKKTMEAYEAFRKTFDDAFDDAADLTIDLATQGRVKSASKITGEGDIFDLLIRHGMDEKKAEGRAASAWEMLSNFRKARREGYAPLSRFGEWFYGIVPADPKKLPVRWESRESTLGARKRFRKLKQQYAGEIAAGEVRAIQPFRKEFESSGALISEFVGADALLKVAPELREAVREELRPYLNKLGTKAHFTQRQVGVPGYETDLLRPTADYLIGLAGFIANAKMFRDMRDMLDRIPESKSRLRKYTQEYVKYLASAEPDFAWLRSLIFHYALGGLRFSSAAVNLSQVPLISIPWLSRYYPLPQVGKEISRAYKDVMAATRLRGIHYRKLPEDVRDDASRSLEDGTLRAQFAREIGYVARRGRHPVVQFTEDLSSFFFDAAEHVNRLVTFIAAHRLGAGKLPKGFKSNFEFSEDVVNKTQFEYARYNRPQFSWPRGVVGKLNPVLAMFKSFPINHIEVMWRLVRGTGAGGKGGSPDPKRRKRDLIALGAMISLGQLAYGLYGHPFAETVMAAYDQLYRRLAGRRYDSELAAQQALAEMTDEEVAEVITRGVTRLTPFDMSRSLSMGDPTGLARFFRSGNMADLWAITSMTGRAARGMESFALGDIRAAEQVLPGGAAAVARATRYAKTGRPTSRGGYDLPLGLREDEPLTGLEVLGAAAGFSPTRVSRAYEYTGYLQGLGSDQLKAAFVRRLVDSVSQPEEFKRIWREYLETLEELPESKRFTISGDDIQRRLDESRKPAIERMIEDLPKEQRPKAFRSPIPGF